MTRPLAVPVSRADARAFVTRHHSHHWAPNTWLLSVGVEFGGSLVCVATLELPKARMLCNGTTAEISRVCSDGTTKNAATVAIGALSRAALALGYRRLVSYLLLGERGTSYRAANWHPAAISAGGKWDRPSRPAGNRETTQVSAKVRWEYGPDAAPVDNDVLLAVNESVGKIELPGRVASEPLFSRCVA